MTLELICNNDDVVIFTTPNGNRLAISFEGNKFECDYMTEKTSNVFELSNGLVSGTSKYPNLDDLNGNDTRHTPKDVDKDSMFPLSEKANPQHVVSYDHLKEDIYYVYQNGELKEADQEVEKGVNHVKHGPTLKLIEVTGEVTFKAICTGAYYSVVNSADANYTNAITFGVKIFEAIKDCESTLELHPRIYRVAEESEFNVNEIGIISRYVFDEITKALMENSEEVSSDSVEDSKAADSREAGEGHSKDAAEKEVYEGSSIWDTLTNDQEGWEKFMKGVNEEIDKQGKELGLGNIFNVPYHPKDTWTCVNCASWKRTQDSGETLVCNCTMPSMNNGITYAVNPDFKGVTFTTTTSGATTQ